MPPLDRAVAELDALLAAERDLLTKLNQVRGEKSKVIDFIDRYRRYDEPQPQAAQTAPRMQRASSSAAGPETVESSAPITETPADQPGSVAVSDDAGTAPAAEAMPPVVSAAPNGRPRNPDSLLSRIRAYVADHPDATAPEIARALDARTQSVRNAVAKSGIKLKLAMPGRARKAEPTPDPAPAPEPPAAPPAHRVTYPKGKLFWLKNDDGQYLNRYVSGFTRDRREAWTGTEQQLAGCRRNYEIARALREVVVEKEQPAARQFA